MITLYYSTDGFRGNIEIIVKELTEMSVTKLRIVCNDKCCPKTNLKELRQDATMFLEKLIDGKQVIVDLPGFEERSFAENGKYYLETIDLQVEIK